MSDARHTPLSNATKRRLERLIRIWLPIPATAGESEQHELDWNIGDGEIEEDAAEESVARL
jgi:hypothetical protein